MVVLLMIDCKQINTYKIIFRIHIFRAIQSILPTIHIYYNDVKKIRSERRHNLLQRRYGHLQKRNNQILSQKGTSKHHSLTPFCKLSQLLKIYQARKAIALADWDMQSYYSTK